MSVTTDMVNAEIPLEFYSKSAYFKAMTEHASKAKRGDRLAAASMAFNPAEPLVHNLLDAFNTAAKHGADVQLIIDAYNLIFAEDARIPGPLWVGREPSATSFKPFRAVVAEMDRLRSNGGTYTMINRPTKRFSNIFGGRSHIKFSFYNDEVFVGGCNLNDSNELDMMVCLRDPKTAAMMKDFAESLKHTPVVREALDFKDVDFAVDASTRLFIDAGVKRQSIIYDHALQLIDEANEWLVLTSTFLPHGRTMEKLLAAQKRGVHVELLFAHPLHHPPIDAQLQQLILLRERLRLPKEFLAGQLPKSTPKIHAKLVANERAAMIGSHNYVPTGTDFGTAEIALLRRTPTFSREASLAIINQTYHANSPRFNFLNT